MSTNFGFLPARIIDVPSVAPNVSVSSAQFLPQAVGTETRELPPEAAKMVPGLVQELMKSTSLMNYAQGSTVKAAQFADKILDRVSMSNIGSFQKPLTDVLVLCNTVNAKSIRSGDLNSRIPFMNRVKLFFAGTKARAMSNINSVRGQLEDISKEMIKNEVALIKNVEMLEEMATINRNEYYSLSAHVVALEQVIPLKQRELDEFVQKNQSSTDPLIGVEIANRKDFMAKLDKKLYDLRIIALLCIDTEPMIQDERRSSERMVEKFRNVRDMVLPQWKKQAALMLSSLENTNAATLATLIDDTSNSIVKNNADAVAKNSANTARIGERGVLDIESMEHINQVLIDSANEAIQIASEGSQYRAKAQTKMVELKQSLNLNVIQRRAA